LSWVDNNDALTAEKQGRGTDRGAYQTSLEKWQRDFSKLNADCQYKSGVVDTLATQNRDQQITVNNCQTEALKLLEPQSFHWEALALEVAEKDPSNSSFVKARWLLLANKLRTPAEFTFACSQPIISAESKVVGSTANTTTVPLTKENNGE
jgi:hypothetical protein